MRSIKAIAFVVWAFASVYLKAIVILSFCSLLVWFNYGQVYKDLGWPALSFTQALVLMCAFQVLSGETIKPDFLPGTVQANRLKCWVTGPVLYCALPILMLRIAKWLS